MSPAFCTPPVALSIPRSLVARSVPHDWSAAALPLRGLPLVMACSIASTRPVAAAARPAAPCSSRVGCALPAPWRPAGSRAPSALQAVAGAAPKAAPAPSSTAQPAQTEFPSVAVSRMLHGNRAFVEQHRCGARLCRGWQGVVGGGLGAGQGREWSSRRTGKAARAPPEGGRAAGPDHRLTPPLHNHLAAPRAGLCGPQRLYHACGWGRSSAP